MDYLEIFNEDIAFNAANPRYLNDVSDDEYGERRPFQLGLVGRTLYKLQAQRLLCSRIK